MVDEEVQISKKTKRGIFLLVFLCLIIIYTPRFLSWLRPSENLELSYEEIRQAEKVKNTSAQYEKKRKKSFQRKSKFKRPPRKFDPNLYSAEQWESLGLSEKQVNVLFKFTKYGIRSNEDLKKIFVISDELFSLIKDSTFYSEKGGKENLGNKEWSDKKPEFVKPQIVPIELNTAASEELETIPGIGPFLAKVILEKREKLGGFYSKSQLLEVYKFDQEKLDAIDKYIRINPEVVSKLNINEVSIEELRKHPYFDYKVANSIVKMRQQKGKYSRIEELKESVLIKEELFQKLKPYVYL